MIKVLLTQKGKVGKREVKYGLLFAPIFLLYNAVHTDLLAVPKLLEVRNTNLLWFWINSPISQNLMSLHNFCIKTKLEMTELGHYSVQVCECQGS